MRGRTLIVRFSLARPARVQIIGRRKGRTVARTRARTLRLGRRPLRQRRAPPPAAPRASRARCRSVVAARAPASGVVSGTSRASTSGVARPPRAQARGAGGLCVPPRLPRPAPRAAGGSRRPRQRDQQVLLRGRSDPSRPRSVGTRITVAVGASRTMSTTSSRRSRRGRSPNPSRPKRGRTRALRTPQPHPCHRPAHQVYPLAPEPAQAHGRPSTSRRTVRSTAISAARPESRRPPARCLPAPPTRPPTATTPAASEEQWRDQHPGSERASGTGRSGSCARPSAQAFSVTRYSR